MSYDISKKGEFYFVTNTASERVIGRFKSEDQAKQMAQTETIKERDYFKDTKTSIKIRTEEDE